MTNLEGSLPQLPPQSGERGYRRYEIAQGIKASLAAGLGMYPIGIAFGLLVIQYRFEWWAAPLFSGVIFAGSTEMLVIALVASSAPLGTIALTTLLVNFRHVFYAFTFPLHVVKNPLARFFSVFSLVDEAYALTAAKPHGWTSWRLVTMQFSFYSYCVLGGLTGVAIAELIPFEIKGLEFALCALFVTLTLDSCRSKKEIPSLLLAGVSFSIALVVVPGQPLFAGLLIFLATLIVRYVLERISSK